MLIGEYPDILKQELHQMQYEVGISRLLCIWEHYIRLPDVSGGQY